MGEDAAKPGGRVVPGQVADERTGVVDDDCNEPSYGSGHADAFAGRNLPQVSLAVGGYLR